MRLFGYGRTWKCQPLHLASSLSQPFELLGSRGVETQPVWLITASPLDACLLLAIDEEAEVVLMFGMDACLRLAVNADASLALNISEDADLSLDTGEDAELELEVNADAEIILDKEDEC